jgi:pimeloyl-ACP methyl ester carboxylesterase
MPDGDKKIELGIKVRFPEKWIMENAEQVKEYVQFQKGLNFNETLGLMHSNAIESWDGVCDEIKNIKVPTLVIVGDKDEITWTNNAKYIQGQIPDSELTVIKNSGHGLIYQYPDVISRKILDFLR